MQTEKKALKYIGASSSPYFYYRESIYTKTKQDHNKRIPPKKTLRRKPEIGQSKGNHNNMVAFKVVIVNICTLSFYTERTKCLTFIIGFPDELSE